MGVSVLVITRYTYVMPFLTGAEARQVLGRPWPLIPASDADGAKKPIRRWAHLQTVSASDEYDDVSAPLWAFPTGQATGIVVLDFDGAEGAETLATIAMEPHVRTGSGGAHIYVAAPSFKIGNRVRALPGMDIRGEGGLAYVIGESSKGAYAIVSVLVPYTYADLPIELQKILKGASPKGNASRAPSGWMPGPGYRKALCEHWCDQVLGAGAGERNKTLNTAAFMLGRANVPVDEVGPALYEAAMAAGLDEAEANDTINSGWSAGHNG